MNVWIEIAGLVVSTGILGALARKFGQYLSAKVKNEYWKGVIERIDEAAIKASKLVFQAYVGPIKKEGRSLTDDEKKIAMEMAKQELKAYLGVAGIKEALYILGVNQEQLDKMFGVHIEASVYDEKTWNKK